MTRCRCYILPVTKEVPMSEDEIDPYYREINDALGRMIDETIWHGLIAQKFSTLPSGWRPLGMINDSDTLRQFRSQEVPMPQPVNPFDALFARTFIPPHFFLHTDLRPMKSAEQVRNEKRENAFGLLDVQNGDEIELKGATSTLQGKVTQVRDVGTKQDPEFQVRLADFDETPHGNHNVWFPVRRYESVRVTKRGYRWTTRDRAIAALMHIGEATWIKHSETSRAVYRNNYGPQADRVIAAVQNTTEVE